MNWKRLFFLALILAQACDAAPDSQAPRLDSAGTEATSRPTQVAREGLRATLGSRDAATWLESFGEATERHGLPPGLLEALAYTETGLRPSVHHEDADNGCGEHQSPAGIMGLRPQGASGATIELAALAAGLEPATVASDTGANIEAAAALLRAWAGPQARSWELLDWWEALELWSGYTQGGDTYAGEILEMLARGRRLEMLDGTVVEILEREAEGTQQRLKGLRAGNSPDYPGADYKPASTNNYTASNRGAAQIEKIVIHVTQGSYSGSISWFQNGSSSVSAHYVVKSSNGAITQCVLDKDIAWHAGHWATNEASIGIEHEGWVADPSWFTDAMYQASANLTKALCDKYGIPKTRQYIIGHFEVPGCANPNGGGKGCHTDPGVHWNWDKYMALVQGGAPPPPPPPQTGDLLGFIREGDIFSGPGIAGAAVSLNTGASTTTNGDGLYSFGGLAVGEYTVTASKAGYITKSEAKGVTAGIQNWKSMALDPAPPPPPPPPPQEKGTLIGFVREGDIFTGPGIAGATVSLSNGAATSTDAEGLYVFADLPVGPYTVTAAKAGYVSQSASKDVVANIQNWRSIALQKETPPPPPPPPPPPEDAGTAPEEDTSGGESSGGESSGGESSGGESTVDAGEEGSGDAGVSPDDDAQNDAGTGSEDPGEGPGEGNAGAPGEGGESPDSPDGQGTGPEEDGSADAGGAEGTSDGGGETAGEEGTTDGGGNEGGNEGTESASEAAGESSDDGAGQNEGDGGGETTAGSEDAATVGGMPTQGEPPVSSFQDTPGAKTRVGGCHAASPSSTAAWPLLLGALAIGVIGRRPRRGSDRAR
jgi:N-acetyl-anhydromuramyl-L-alanine amidase AmpD